MKNSFTSLIQSLIGLTVAPGIKITDAYENGDDLQVETTERGTTIYCNDVDTSDEDSAVDEICSILAEVNSECTNVEYYGSDDPYDE